MSSTGINTSMFSLLSSQGSSAFKARSNAVTGDFSASLAQQMASFQLNSLTSLFGGDETGSALDLLATDSASQGLSASGRNLSLFDPESGYRMMSTINNLEVSFKAQFAELSAMEDGVADMEQAGEDLAVVDSGMDQAGIKAKVQEFVADYNAWVGRFGNAATAAGVLANSWTAATAQHELEQNIHSLFNGASDGFSGLRDLGLSIDESTHQLTLDSARLDAALASNKTGVVNTLDQFSANFAKSADLLNDADNVIPHQLDNLDRVIDYIADHKSDLQQEFGLGDAARPSDSVSQALAAYNRMLAG